MPEKNKNSLFEWALTLCKKGKADYINKYFGGAGIENIPPKYITIETAIDAIKKSLLKIQYVPRFIQDTSEFQEAFCSIMEKAKIYEIINDDICFTSAFSFIEPYIKSESLKLLYELKK